MLEFLGVNEPLGEPKALEGEPVSLLNESSACLLVYGEFVAFEDTFGHLVGDQLTVSESWGLASDV